MVGDVRGVELILPLRSNWSIRLIVLCWTRRFGLTWSIWLALLTLIWYCGQKVAKYLLVLIVTLDAGDMNRHFQLMLFSS